MKLAVILLLMLLLTICAGTTFLLFTPVIPAGEVFVDLPAGTGTHAISRKLRDAGVLRSQWSFLLLRLVKGGTLKAGEYRFDTPANAEQVYARIQHGDVYTRTVLIPEGFNLYDIANAVEAAGMGSRTLFLQAAHDNVDLIAAWSLHAESLEGYLYPDTYHFTRHTTPRGMQEAMVKRFRSAIARLGITEQVAQTITLASLVEKEVHFDDERALAAGVFRNRLDRGMPLQTDPTVIYAAQRAARWTGVIHRSDLDFDSPYNTYRHTGLPPAPICSPGAAALLAAMHPATTDKLYFVADASGHTQFSAGLKEHAGKVAMYRQSIR